MISRLMYIERLIHKKMPALKTCFQANRLEIRLDTRKKEIGSACAKTEMKVSYREGWKGGRVEDGSLTCHMRQMKSGEFFRELRLSMIH